MSIYISCCSWTKLQKMGKTKKKEVKKSDKSNLELPEDNSKISSPSVTPVEESPSSLPKSLRHDKPTKQEEAPIEDPVFEVYEEPVLASLVVERYEGDTVHGLYEGEGVARFKGGNVYRGEFHMNFPMGQGIYTWPNGIRYEGQVSKAIRNGKGLLLSSDRHVLYVGEWYRGARHGKGTIYYNPEQTSWYEGDWVKNKKEGWGIQCFKSGNIYEGHWKNNNFSGEGIMKWLSSNEEYSGQWLNGIQNGHGTHTWFIKRVPGSQYSLRNKYVGNFVNGQRQGHGLFYYANGAMYDGEWKNNKKHGMGKFIFKNGKIYVGEFVEDQIAEFPNFKYDRVNTPDLSGIRTRSPRGEEKLSISRSSPAVPSLSGSYIELDISSLLNMFPENEQEEELKQVEYRILRNLTELRKIYKFYSSLGSQNASDNAFVMTKLQFWRFLKDCRFHHHNLTLTEMDRLLVADNVESEPVLHSPYTTMLLRTFLTNIIYLAYHICQKQIPKKCSSIADCLSKILTENILPHAKNVNGFLFCDPQKTQHAMCYMDNCWSIYSSCCQPNTSAPYEPTMTMRHFVWTMKDLNIIGEELTITHLVDILAADDPSVRNSNEINLEMELTFLEFFEALLGCAVVCVTSDLAELSITEMPIAQCHRTEIDEVDSRGTELQPDNLSQVNSPCVPEGKDPDHNVMGTGKCQIRSTPSDSTKNLQRETGDDKWFHQISLFFTKMFFPAHEYTEQLKQEIPKIRARRAELARIQQLEEEEEARLKALKDEEEARRILQLETDKANAVTEEEQIDKETGDEQKSIQCPATPKEEPQSIQQPSSAKTNQGSKKKKK
uniref:Uncharacterized protein n=1 Tax=Leptobrachium leishanense TaxID=445787 RepID=A0A8C5PUZ8_9ANUR